MPELGGDVASLQSILDSDFVAVGPLGFVLSKVEWLDRHRSGDLKYEALIWEDTYVRHYPDMAIAVGALAQRATFRGNQVPLGNLRATQIIIRRIDGWAIVGLHLSQIAQPPAP